MSLHSVSSLSSVMSSQRRLSTRRGSASALDPFNIHAEHNNNPNRVSSSTLTIVRVAQPPAPTPPISLHEPPSSPVLSQRRHHFRPGSAANHSPSPASTPDAGPQSSRVSFAFSSFSGGPAHGGPSSPSRERAPSPSSSPRLRPSSPRLSASSPFSSKPRLTPDQLVDLARNSASPRPFPLSTTPHSGPSTPPAIAHSPLLGSHSPAFHTASQAVAPATFTPLPDDMYLPFVDRPSEVASLISTPPDAKLFTLLAQTFSSRTEENPDQPIEQTSDLPTDPAEWTYRHLVFHLTTVDRDVAPDTIWAYAARKCIISHSELIWERVKGALGIPPELDIDWDFRRGNDDDDSSSSGSVATDEISDDEGKGAHGHWSDWDATIDSPIIDRRSKRLSMDSSGGFASRVDHEYQDGLYVGAFSPPPSVRYESDSEMQITIEPIIAQPQSSTNPPPLSLPVSLSSGISDGLGDIAEGAEEEEEGEGAGQPTGSGLGASMTQSNPNILLPSQIQGLKICTSPQPSFLDTPPIMSPMSPFALASGAIPIPGVIQQQHTGSASFAESRSHSRTGSFSSVGPFRKTDSSSSIAAMLANFKPGGYGSGSEADASSILSDLHVGGDLVGEHRNAGNPLFPSSFARLAGGPTLKANSRKKPRTHSHGAGVHGNIGRKGRSWVTGSLPAAAPVTASGGGGNA